MPIANNVMHGPVYYNYGWTILGLGFLLVTFCIVLVILRITRKKPVKTLSNVPMKPIVKPSMSELKLKYTNQIARVEADFNNRAIKASEAHQQISLAARAFFSEARNFKANYMTLQDLKKSRHKDLTAIIDEYYANEFDTLQRNSVHEAAEKARQLIEEQK